MMCVAVVHVHSSYCLGHKDFYDAWCASGAIRPSLSRVQADLLPRLCGLCLGTTSASVRTAALLSMGKLLPSIELDEAKKMMTVCGKVGSAPAS